MKPVHCLWGTCVVLLFLPIPTWSCRSERISIRIDGVPIEATSATGRIIGSVGTPEVSGSRPLDFANVIVVGTTMGAMARNGGRFTLENVPAGTYGVVARFVGYTPQVVGNVRVEPNGTTVVKFCLGIDRSIVQTCVVTSALIQGVHPAARSRAVFPAGRLVHRAALEAVASMVVTKDIRRLTVAQQQQAQVRNAGSVNQGASVRPRPAPRTPVAVVPIRCGDKALPARAPQGPERPAEEAALLACACGTSRSLSAVELQGQEASETEAPGVANLPRTTCLRKVAPNPFNPATTIHFDMAEPGDVELRIYDVRGRQVRRLLTRRLDAGQHAVVWDGKTDDALSAPSAVYFLRMVTGSVNASRKLSLIR